MISPVAEPAVNPPMNCGGRPTAGAPLLSGRPALRRQAGVPPESDGAASTAAASTRGCALLFVTWRAGSGFLIGSLAVRVIGSFAARVAGWTACLTAGWGDGYAARSFW